MIFAVAFGLLSAGLLRVSWSSLRVPGSHGFFRFFAWEMMALLFLLIAPHWLDEPSSAHQLISWALLMASILLVLTGVHALRSHGDADAMMRGDTHLLGFEKTTRLVESGLYRFIRHPMYSSLLFLTWGFYWKYPAPLTTLLVVATSALLVITARTEEQENLRFFGPPYQDYMGRTKMFVPFLI